MPFSSPWIGRHAYLFISSWNIGFHQTKYNTTQIFVWADIKYRVNNCTQELSLWWHLSLDVSFIHVLFICLPYNLFMSFHNFLLLLNTWFIHPFKWFKFICCQSYFPLCFLVQSNLLIFLFLFLKTFFSPALLIEPI